MIQFLDIRLPPRFWSKCIPEPNSGCWLWFGATNEDGYGHFSMDRRPRGSHRIAYEELVGVPAPTLVLDHKCQTPCCVNPAHLEPVTQRVNIQRGLAPAGQNARKTTCHRGHPLAGDNLIRSSNGRRHCRICQRAHERANARRDTIAEREWSALSAAIDALKLALDDEAVAGYQRRRFGWALKAVEQILAGEDVDGCAAKESTGG